MFRFLGECVKLPFKMIVWMVGAIVWMTGALIWTFSAIIGAFAGSPTRPAKKV